MRRQQSSLHGKGTRPGCLLQQQQQRLLLRLALLLLGLVFVCGAATGVAFLIRLRPESGGGGSGGRGTGLYQIAFHLPDSGVDQRQRRGPLAGRATDPLSATADGAGGRVHLASNLSLLLAGSWPMSARFHPTSFKPESEVLNKTVLCDRPVPRDTSMVYSEPTWLCKNIRVDQQRLPFSDTTSRTLEELMLSRQKELLGSGPSRDTCGFLPDRRNNVLLLCELLLVAMQHGGPATDVPPASSVHIPYGNCSIPEHKRILLVGMAIDDAVWYTEDNWKPGFVTDLYCSFAA